ncbi:MAG: hypothetical protein CMF62_03940 [Magnetococcales bacterium]|nr:hypothetical protein [Magnetococcales bacterium]|tara:strand:- start:14727 stop:15611 length:885 start_codon:yes stop_codon:yes gene_type:complete
MQLIHPKKVTFESYKIGAIFPIIIPFLLYYAYQIDYKPFEIIFDIYREIFIGMITLDFVAANLHWFEDHFVNPRNYQYMPSFLKKPFETAYIFNMEHHALPFMMQRYTLWETIQDLFLASIPINIIFLFTGVWYYYPLFCITFTLSGIFINEFHKAQHTPTEKRWWLINLMFETMLFVDRDAHRMHHIDGVNNYSVFVNANKFYDAFWFSWLNSVFGKYFVDEAKEEFATYVDTSCDENGKLKNGISHEMLETIVKFRKNYYELHKLPTDDEYNEWIRQQKAWWNKEIKEIKLN